jgi:cob(I)alamin adenosyltransferase
MPSSINQKELQIKVGYFHYYYGNGCGKTSIALGRIVRALGHNLHPILFQFLKKHDPNGNQGFFYGEYRTLTEILHVPVIQFGQFNFIRSPNDISPQLRQEIKAGIPQIQNSLNGQHYDLVILDELPTAIKQGLINETQILEIIQKRAQNVELMITGRELIPSLGKIADYLMEIREEKHPFQKGILARLGVEY